MADGSIGAYGLVEDFRYGRAFDQLVPLPNFAGNATRVYKVGGTYVERVTAVTFSLQAVGGAGLRIGVVDLLDQGGVVFASAASPFTVAAGSTSLLSFASGVLQAGANNAARITVPLPTPFLQPTYSVRLSVIAGVVADTVSNIRLLTSKFSTAPADFSPGQGTEASWREVGAQPVPLGSATGA